ncbi:MAG TPA: hypothetical protein VK807_12655, partial [Gemmatimonadaceae bacterium]|nr:hypothetical protein [Gemmatimonadaceae bacterium]
MTRLHLSLATALMAVASCAHPTGSTTAVAPSGSASSGSASSMDMSPGEPMPDPRVGLKAGLWD